MKKEIVDEVEMGGHFHFPSAPNGVSFGKVFLLDKTRDEARQIGCLACDNNEIFVEDEETLCKIAQLFSDSYKGKLRRIWLRDDQRAVYHRYTDDDCLKIFNGFMEDYRRGVVIGYVVPRNWQEPASGLWQHPNEVVSRGSSTW